uniref:helix-turn-helix domain-containing protein n=1 Tax=Trichocoleus desertorum TaxID=1481672 RepID=UPI0025B4082E|nr:helix-turn-helix domain-containing protein [Trichocoleus desertorum]
MNLSKPEFINPLALPALPLLKRYKLPNLPAIYFVLEEQTVIYIGRTVSLLQRWMSHHHLKHLQDRDVRIAWFQCDNLDAHSTLEAQLIKAFKPELNTGGISTPFTGLTALRERKELKTVDVACHLGIAESTVRNWEHGRTIPKLRLDQFGELLRLYGCKFEELEQAMKESMTGGETSA